MKLTRSLGLAIVGLFALFALTPPVQAQESQAIFSGSNLNGWKDEEAKTRVRDGVLTIEQAPGWIRYDDSVNNFVVTMDVRLTSPETKFAVFLRALPTRDKKTVPESGRRITLQGAPGAGPAAPWQRLEIEAVGFTVKARIDGAQVYAGDDLVNPDGYLALAALGGAAEIKNIQLTRVKVEGTLQRKDGVYMVGYGIEEPTPEVPLDPPYPPIAQAARIQGAVILSVVVLPTGDVSEIYVIQSQPGGLDKAATDAVRAAKYKASTLNGKPVATMHTLRVTFRLR